MDRDYWLREFYAVIGTFSSKDRQRSDWVVGDGERQSYWGEDVTIILDDLGVEQYFDQLSDDFAFPRQVSEEIKKLRDLLLVFSEKDMSFESLMADSRWDKVIDQSKEVKTVIEREFPTVILPRPNG